MSGLTAEQHEIRRTGIGASEIAAVLDLSPHMSRMELWRIKRGLLPAFDGNEDTTRGQRFEPIVAQYTQDAIGQEIVIPSQLTIRHRDYPFIVASPDRIPRILNHALPGQVERSFVAELKTARNRWKWGAPMSADVPPHIYVQTQWQMIAAESEYGTTMDFAYVGVMFDYGFEFELFVVPFDAELAPHLIESGRRFWDDHVVTGVPPMIDATKGSTDYLNWRYPSDRQAPIHCDGRSDLALDVEREAFALRDAKLRAKEVEAECALHENRLRELIGEAAGAKGNFGSITWKSGKPVETTDWKAIVETMADDPELGPAVDALRQKNTRVRDGSRSFRTYFKH